jgi:hypothetical protein
VTAEHLASQALAKCGYPRYNPVGRGDPNDRPLGLTREESVV